MSARCTRRGPSAHGPMSRLSSLRSMSPGVGRPRGHLWNPQAVGSVPPPGRVLSLCWGWCILLSSLGVLWRWCLCLLRVSLLGVVHSLQQREQPQGSTSLRPFCEPGGGEGATLYLFIVKFLIGWPFIHSETRRDSERLKILG